MDKFLPMFLPIVAFQLFPVLLPLIAWAVGTVKDRIVALAQ